MTLPPRLETSFRLTREEMIWIMNLLGSKTLFGVELPTPQGKKDSTRSEKEKNINGDSLIQKGILQPGAGQKLTEDAQPVMEAVLFPEQTMVVFRDIPGKGRQFFHISKKGEILALHSLPDDNEHYVRIIEKPVDIVTMIADWFPFFLLPVARARFQLKKGFFDKIRALAAQGKTQEALSLFAPESDDTVEKKNLIQAIADRKESGSIARLKIENNDVEEGDSIAVLTDGRTGWMITQEGSSPSEDPLLTVRRTGADFTMTIRQYVETLTGKKLPRREADPSGKSVHFVLSSDELAMSLAAINCKDLSTKMYAAMSGDTAGEQYPDRMKKAQLSLVESGLCTVSERGIPVLAEDLAQAVFPIAKSDFMVQSSTLISGRTAEMSVYGVQGRSFTIYRNYGEPLQLLEYGKHKDLSSHLETMFPDFGMESEIVKKSFPITYGVFEKVIQKIADKGETAKLIASDGIPEADAEMLAVDLENPYFRSMLIRRDAPDSRKKPEEKKDAWRPNALLLLKSPRRSWMIQFHTAGEKGTASITDREGFLRSLAELSA